LQVELVQKQSIWGYHFGKTSPFLKITMSSPPLVRSIRTIDPSWCLLLLANSLRLQVATARGILDKGFSFGTFGRREYASYESNIVYVLRFMVDLVRSLQLLLCLSLCFLAAACQPSHSCLSTHL
jgi:DNA polymerase delta subunit 1